jgi:hypothetical protein
VVESLAWKGLGSIPSATKKKKKKKIVCCSTKKEHGCPLLLRLGSSVGFYVNLFLGCGYIKRFYNTALKTFFRF